MLLAGRFRLGVRPARRRVWSKLLSGGFAAVADTHRAALADHGETINNLRHELTNVRFASDNVRNAIGVLYEAVANGATILPDRVGFPNLL